MVKAILLKPLDGDPEGSEREFDQGDFETLKKLGAVRAVAADHTGLRTDGPTVAEFVTAGYRAENYPPQGYASRSSAEEIADAIAAQQPPAPVEPPAPQPEREKAAPPLPNKKAPAVPNKAV